MDFVDVVDCVDREEMNTPESLLPKHGGYRNLKSFQIAQLVYDVTVRFCSRYLDKKSRTNDQMIQAARSGVQNIAEGSLASATSKKMEIKLTQVARASLEELRLDYEDFLRQRNLPLWPQEEPLRQALINRRCRTADEVAAWIVETCAQSTKSTQNYPTFSANAALVLIAVATALLDRQVARLAQDFTTQGGFTERLYRVRSAERNQQTIKKNPEATTKTMHSTVIPAQAGTTLSHQSTKSTRSTVRSQVHAH